MAILLEEIEVRWRTMFSSLASNADVAPGDRLRTEGLMEAAVLVGEASAEDISQAMCAVYEEVFGHPVEEHFSAQWQVLFPFPQIPAMARRAPVYPSTPD